MSIRGEGQTVWYIRLKHDWGEPGYHIHDFLNGWIYCKVCKHCSKYIEEDDER